MHRFFIRKENITQEGITIDGDDVQHISRVLRLKEGDEIVLCDQQGMDYLAVIEDISKHSIRASIIGQEASKGEPAIEVVLYQGVPKAAKMDLIIQKCTEMGISRIVPVMTARTVVKLESDKDEEKKVVRWTKIAEEAAKQSKRGIVPVIDMPMTLEEALKDCKNLELALVPYELEQQTSVKAALQLKQSKSIGFFVGPEGGFEVYEVDKARQYGVIPVTLGSRIMRTETAGFAILTCIMYEYDQMQVME